MTTSRTRTTPPAEQDQDGKAPPDVADDERPARVEHRRGGIVRHTYLDGADQPHDRYGIVVDPDGPLVAWLPAEPVEHLAEELEEL